MLTSKNLCIIPAKGASTRLKKKNILPLNNKPMLYYPIEAALQSNLFDKVIVSTESDEIAEIAAKKEVEVHKRPEHLAHDPYGVVDVVMNFLETNPEYKSYDTITILMVTSPLIEYSDIQNAYDIYKNNAFNCVISVAKTSHNAQRAVFVRNNQLVPINPACQEKKSQELEDTYDINAAVAILNMKEFITHRTYFPDPVGTHILDDEKAIDIDTEFHYKFAQFLLLQRAQQ